MIPVLPLFIENVFRKEIGEKPYFGDLFWNFFESYSESFLINFVAIFIDIPILKKISKRLKRKNQQNITSQCYILIESELTKISHYFHVKSCKKCLAQLVIKTFQ